MIITSIVENTSAVELPVEHGLSLYIQLDNGERILFDMGQGTLFAENAEKLGLSIEAIDTAIISHGHYDHGGGLSTFLQINKKANVYLNHDAFEPHYSLRDSGLRFIGLDKELVNNDRLVFCSDFTHIREGITLFADVRGKCCCPHGNNLLFGPDKTQNDSFAHEQNLIIEEGENLILIAGCAHNGIINIMEKTKELFGKTPTHVLAGMHLVKSGLSAEEDDAFITKLSSHLLSYPNCHYYTMHCTGTEQFAILKSKMQERIEYLSCGETIAIT